ncbi:MAG TPA: PilZ domain-containing protein [Candidatus Xenobia bacterium]|nr:PilZ domain-containing protein [Candidatus Xenobia bacterium]
MGTTGTYASGIDRREDHRTTFFAEAEYEWGGNKMRARILNLSLGGMLMETRAPLPAMAQFVATLHLAEGPPLEAICVVKRLVPGVGMGVEFVDLKPSDHIRLRRIVESLPH